MSYINPTARDLCRALMCVIESLEATQTSSLGECATAFREGADSPSQSMNDAMMRVARHYEEHADKEDYSYGYSDMPYDPHITGARAAIGAVFAYFDFDPQEDEYERRMEEEE